MKIVRFIAAVAMLTTVAIISSAQQPKPGGTSAPVAAPQTNVAVPDSKMAVIYSDDFMDPKAGIARFATLSATLTREFQPRQTELTNLDQRIQQLTKEITDTAAVADPKTIQTKRDQLEVLQLDLKRKGEDGQAAFTRRRTELFQPLQIDIGKALEAFAKARGITVIVDGSAVPLVYRLESLDITKAFIADFNSKNPATASVTQP